MLLDRVPRWRTPTPFGAALLAAVIVLSWGGDVSWAVDVTAASLYWTDSLAEKIQTGNPDGSNVRDLITTGVIRPWGITLDSARGGCRLPVSSVIGQAVGCLAVRIDTRRRWSCYIDLQRPS